MKRELSAPPLKNVAENRFYALIPLPSYGNGMFNRVPSIWSTGSKFGNSESSIIPTIRIFRRSFIGAGFARNQQTR
jgi:hypothetical protein